MEIPSVRAGRATPLPPDERRAAILLAVRPVLLERGAAVTSRELAEAAGVAEGTLLRKSTARELAEAAGVAEGTLFRVFTDKVTLIREAVLAAVDPADRVPEIEAIDRSLPLADKLMRLMTQGFAHVGEAMRWMGLLHEVGRLGPVGPPAGSRGGAIPPW